MKLPLILIASTGLALAACTQGGSLPTSPPGPVTTTGNMSYPAPALTGQFRETEPARAQTGSMAYPTVTPGVTTRAAPTGNAGGSMAYPSSTPGTTTTVRP